MFTAFFRRLFGSPVSNKKPPHPLDLAYWTLESSPKFEESYFMEDVREYVKKYSTW